MTGIGTKWRIPKKDDDKGWELLEALIKTAQADLEDQHSRHPHIQTKHVRLSGHTLYSFKKKHTWELKNSQLASFEGHSTSNVTPAT